MLCCYFQAAAISTGQQIWLILIATMPNRAYGMNDMSGLEVSTGRDDGITDGTAANLATFLVNRRASLAVYRAVRAHALVQPPVCSSHDCVGILVSYVAGHKMQCRDADCDSHDV